MKNKDIIEYLERLIEQVKEADHTDLSTSLDIRTNLFQNPDHKLPQLEVKIFTHEITLSIEKRKKITKTV
jgi:hypothetical protein